MIEAKKVIAFLESKRINSNKKSNMIENNDAIENGKQLTVNQAIILLDKLGVFTTDVLENVPNTKKALLISLLLGKNDKNIKTAIEKLELKSKGITTSYQRDLDKIQLLLNNLE
jgi:hypothetical protein